MVLTRSFRDTVKARADRDPAFRIGLFQEAVNAFMDGDTETGKIILRDYVNATVGFERLGKELDKNPKNLMRMLSAKGNPRTDSLFTVLAHLKAQENVNLRFEAVE
jgi:DNA-binding phage protein